MCGANWYRCAILAWLINYMSCGNINQSRTRSHYSSRLGGGGESATDMSMAWYRLSSLSSGNPAFSCISMVTGLSIPTEGSATGGVIREASGT